MKHGNKRKKKLSSAAAVIGALTVSFMNIHAKLHPVLNNDLNNLSRLYTEQRNYLSGSLV